jgi:hypothetical protein
MPLPDSRKLAGEVRELPAVCGLPSDAYVSKTAPARVWSAEAIIWGYADGGDGTVQQHGTVRAVPDIFNCVQLWTEPSQGSVHCVKVTARSVASIGDENAPAALPPPSFGKERAMQNRRRFKQSRTLQDRLAAFAEDMREKAANAVGADRDNLLRRARQADTALHLDDWASSPGLQSPK